MDNLTNEQLELITQVVIKTEKQNDKRVQKEKKDWKLRNTNLLLKNYRMLSKHCSGIVPRLEQFEESIFDPSDLTIESLMKYKAKTKEMLDYFDLMFAAYSRYCLTLGGAAERRMEVVSKIYIDNTPLSKVKVAEWYDVDDRTIQRDIKKSVEELSVFLFGIESLGELSALVNKEVS